MDAPERAFRDAAQETELGSVAALQKLTLVDDRTYECFLSSPYRSYLNDISADGRTAVFDYLAAGASRAEIAQIALMAGAKPVSLFTGTGDQYGARLSPDGRWLAYTALESGRPEVGGREVMA